MVRSIKVLLRTEGRFLRKSPLKLDPLRQWKSQEQKPNAWELSFRRIFFELVQLGNLQNGMESHIVLKSVQLKWDNTFSLHGPRTLGSCYYYIIYCHLSSIFLWARASVLTVVISLLMITEIQCLSQKSLVDHTRVIMPTLRCFE